MIAPVIRLDLLRPRLRPVPAVPDKNARHGGNRTGAKDAGNVVAKSSKTSEEHNTEAHARLNAPDVEHDRARLDVMQLLLRACANEARSETTKLGFELASEAVLLAYNALMCEEPARAGDANLSTEFRTILDGTMKRLSELRCETTKALTIRWVINVLDKARENLTQGYTVVEIAAEIENSASRRPIPIEASVEEWRRAIKYWRGAKVQGRGNPRTGTSYKPQEVVCKLLHPNTGKAELAKKANAMRTKYRELFA